MNAARIVPVAIASIAGIAAIGGCERAASPQPVTSIEEAQQTNGGAGGAWTPIANPEISFAEAANIAEQRHPEMMGKEIDLKAWGRDRYVVTLFGEDQLRHVVVDADTQEVTDEEIEYIEDMGRKRDLEALQAELGKGDYTLADWAGLATANYNAELVREIELQLGDNNQPLLEVELRSERDIVTWKIDPEAGEIIGREGSGDDAPIRPTGLAR